MESRRPVRAVKSRALISSGNHLFTDMRWCRFYLDYKLQPWDRAENRSIQLCILTSFLRQSKIGAAITQVWRSGKIRGQARVCVNSVLFLALLPFHRLPLSFICILLIARSFEMTASVFLHPSRVSFSGPQLVDKRIDDMRVFAPTLRV